MKKIAMGLMLAALVMVSCKDDKKKMESDEVTDKEVVEEVEEVDVKKLTMTLESKSGSTATGTITFYEENGVVGMEATLSGLTPGTHAIHIHEKADCTSEDGKSSGGHWNPTFEPHASWGAEGGYHKGDIGNFEADENGNGSVVMKTDEWCLGCGDEKKDILGKAIIVHQGADDFTSQPSGAAGARISCGGIIE
jgi:Cu-Zn family superoxide dismutase